MFITESTIKIYLESIGFPIKKVAKINPIFQKTKNNFKIREFPKINQCRLFVYDEKITELLIKNFQRPTLLQKRKLTLKLIIFGFSF